MERHPYEEQLKDVLDLATDLLRQGEQCARVGLGQQAIEILSQVWTISADCAPNIADQAAWNVGWLLAQTGQYGDAAIWFARVTKSPDTSALWPSPQQSLLQMCEALARQVQPDATNTPPMIALTTAVSPLSGTLPPLTITSLGRFQVTRAGIVLPTCKTRKAIAIFRYLLIQRHRSAHKDELIDLFWPEAQPQDAAHSLHVAISSLRRYLDPHVGSYLLLDAGRYYINDNVPIEDDCTTFLRLSDAGQQRWRAGDLQGAQQSYSIALKSYQGDYYLDDHDLLWEVAEQERLLSRYLTALDYLGRILVAQGRFEAAIECYQQLLQRDNYREDVHCHVMSCYQQLGRRNEALRQYHVCASMLADDFGLHPMPETRALYDEIIGDIAQR